MKMQVNISEEEYQQLLDRAKEELRHEITEEKVKEYFEKNPYLSLIALCKMANVYRRYHEIIENLDSEDECKRREARSRESIFIIAIYQLMYEKV